MAEGDRAISSPESNRGI